MKHLTLAVGLLASLGTGAAVYLHLRNDGELSEPASSPSIRSVRSVQTAVAVTGPVPPRPSVGKPEIDFKSAFRQSRSYWEYAHTVLAAARAGNATAQFYLSQAIERCDENNRMYFVHRGQALSLEEGLQYAARGIAAQGEKFREAQANRAAHHGNQHRFREDDEQHEAIGEAHCLHHC